MRTKRGILRTFATLYYIYYLPHTMTYDLHKSLFILCFLLFGSLAASAQVGSPRNDWAIGVNAGATINRVLFSPHIRQNPLVAPTAGITARYTSEKYFSLLCALQVELNFAQLGWDENIYSATSEKLPDTYRRTINYLQMPFLAHLGLGREHRGFKGFLIAGPQLGYALSDREVRSATWTLRTVEGQEVPNRANNVFAQYEKSIEHRFDYGITAGLGVEWSTRLGHFIFDARYYYGLSDLFGNAKKDPFGRSPHNTIAAKLTYLIDLKK